MKSLIKGLIVMAVIFAVTVPVSADTELKFSGQIRLREEVDKKDFRTEVTFQNWADLRTRVGLEAIVDNNSHVFVQFQDSRRLGGYDQFGHRASGTLNDGKNVDVHQAYFKIDRVLVDGLGFKAGRFEMNFGNQRVFGAVGWSNVGRAWEGGMGWYDQETFKVTAFGLKAIEVNDMYYNGDFDIGGFYATYKPYNVSGFYFYEYDADTSGYWINLNRLDRMNLGLHIRRDYPAYKIDFEFNGVYQWGKMPRGLYNPFTQGPRDKIDIKAYMFAAELGYSFSGSVNGRIAAGIDYTSGDDDDADDEVSAYDNLYLTGHKFHGFMDYFTDAAKAGKPYATAGLVDIVLRADIDPYTNWNAKLDAHFFSTNKDYMFINSMGDLVTTNKAGIELDATLSTTVIEGMTLVGGASAFFADDDFAEAAFGAIDGDPGLWFYTMTVINF